jgi:hypothetical protein
MFQLKRDHIDIIRFSKELSPAVAEGSMTPLWRLALPRSYRIRRPDDAQGSEEALPSGEPSGR